MRRRLFAGTMALALNGALISLIVFAPRVEAPAPTLTVLDLAFVSIPPEPEPVAESEMEDSPPPSEEPERRVEPEPVSDQPAEVTSQAAVDPPANDTASTDDDEETATTSAGLYALPDAPIPLPDGPGSTAETVRALFCLSSSDGNRKAGHCPEDSLVDGQRLLQFASDENKARAAAAALANLNAAQLQALLGSGRLPVRDLAGQPTLADVTTRPTSSADQMRDTLPPLHPDPGFGD